jgi:predicted anti-sigma-YlaC factor YlaD
MKSCNEFQESILNGNITEEIMIHLENCDECKKIYDLINKSNNELAFVLPAAVIDKEIKKAFVSANKKIKFRYPNKKVSFR